MTYHIGTILFYVNRVKDHAIAGDGSDTNTEMELFHPQRQPKQLFN